MSNDCSIAVVIPTYNRAHLIERAIHSVLAQTLPPTAIVVVDDGSTDDTGTVCARFAGRVQYIKQTNAGAAAARNHGVRLASQPWVAFLDSDDVWTPGHLERMRAAIVGTGGAAAFYFADMQMTAVDGGGTLWESCGFRPAAPFELTRDATDWMLLKRQPAMLQCGVFNTEVFLARGGFDASYRVAEDTEFFCRLGIGGAACAVSGVGCVQTADDSAHNRLTHQVSGRSEAFWGFYIRMWREVLRHPTLTPAQRRLVRFNRAEAHVCLGRLLWRSGRRLRGAGQILRGALADPRLAAWMVRHRTTAGYEATVRG